MTPLDHIAAFLATKLGKVLIFAAALALAALVAWLLFASWTGGKTAKTETKLGAAQVEAATGSGRDAVGTVAGHAQTSEEIDNLTRSNADDIFEADGADAPVAAGVRDAGKRSLCKRAAYRDSKQCLQQPAAE